MKIWYVIFADQPCSAAVHQKWEGWPGALSQFDVAQRTGAISGRSVLGMWIVDQETPGADVVERYGRVPPPIKERHDARQRAQQVLRQPSKAPCARHGYQPSDLNLSLLKR